jgi:formamidopyrimidine-DNA glycosylase
MPEGLEAEIWRRELLAVVGRRIERAWVDTRVAPRETPDLMAGRTIVDVVRRGKVVVLELDDVDVGLHLGMTGRIVTDGESVIDQLEYASAADRPEWDRLRVETTGRAEGSPPAIRVNDPRRLGRISIDPDLERLGPDVLDITSDTLARRLATRRRAIKATLLDQAVLAGLGNLLADEVLFWAGLDPRRGTGDLGGDEVLRLASAIRRRLPIMLRRGGSTTGTLDPDIRRSLGPCPRDGAALRRATVGGRTTVWCSEHQT